MLKILLNADIDGAVGGINVWAKHIISNSNADNSEIILEAFPDGRKDFTVFTKNKFLRIVDGARAYSVNAFRLIKKIRSQNFDIVHINSSASFGLIRDLLYLKIAHYNNIKTVVHFHFGRIPSLAKQNNWEWKLLLQVTKATDYIVVLDQMSYNTLINEGLYNISKIPNPIAPIVTESIVAHPVAERLQKEVLYVGQCYREKGIYDLVKACSLIPNISLKIIGSISQNVKRDLELIANNKIKIKIEGIRPYDQVLEEMKRCGVFVLPSHSEGFPNVILEAMACGCPIVSTDAGAIPEMLDAENGYKNGICVKACDVEGLKNAICRMLDDREYALQCGVNSQKRVNELYSMPKVWIQLVRMWKNLATNEIVQHER